VNLNYQANNTFARVHMDKARYLFIRGPVGSGKSSGCVWHCVMSAMKQPVQYDGVRRSRYGVLRASYPNLKATTIKTWKFWFKNLVNIVYDTPIRGEIIIPHPDGKSTCHIELVFIALDREEDVNKLQSMELTGAHMHEVAEMPRGVHQMLKSRINREPLDKREGIFPVEPFIIADYNAVPNDHWLYKIAEEERPPRHSFYHQPPAVLLDAEGDLIDVDGNRYSVNPYADNVEWLSEGYYEDQVFGAEPDWVNVMLMNNYGELRTGKPVYPEYIDNIHYNEKFIEPAKGITIIIGMDLGLTPAAAFTQLTLGGRFQVFDEITTEDCSIRKFCEDILKPHIQNKYPGHNFILVLDPAASQRSQNDAKSAAQIVKEAGLPYILGKSNDDTKRREAVVYFLRKVNGFMIGPNCIDIRKGFISEFKYEKKRSSIVNVRAAISDLFKVRWEKNHYSHIHEAVQYAAMEASEGRTAKQKGRPKSLPHHNQPADSVSGY